MAKMNVSYSRLFSIGNYQNEKIVFSTEVDEKDANITLGTFFMNVLDIEKTLQRYRDAIGEEHHQEIILDQARENVALAKSQITNKKIKISEIAELLEKGELEQTEAIERRLRHACDSQSLKSMKKRLEDLKSQVQPAEEEVLIKRKIREVLEARINDGNFSLQGIEKAKHHFSDSLF